ncbi:hypothetical protein [Mesorhizobium tianshanense]|uniref:hypothetical protein n=1 Tax=Mesorhizobium tianshanense TaxID=39844 RepID=UPI0011A2BD95|nr:hypothetical protein [Mesorhizobium tianshanense]
MTPQVPANPANAEMLDRRLKFLDEVIRTSRVIVLPLANSAGNRARPPRFIALSSAGGLIMVMMVAYGVPQPPVVARAVVPAGTMLA